MLQQALGYLNDLKTATYYGETLLMPLLNLIFAVAVYVDARRLAQRGTKPTLVWGVIWALATLVAGLLAAGLYWVVHHSTLRPQQQSGESRLA